MVFLPSAHGTLVITSVTPDSPVGRAGIQRGDVLVTVNGQPVTIADSQKIVALKVPGAQLKLGILRKGQEKEFTVTVDPLRATVTFVTVENGQVLKVAPKWALTWLGKNRRNIRAWIWNVRPHQRRRKLRDCILVFLECAQRISAGHAYRHVHQYEQYLRRRGRNGQLRQLVGLHDERPSRHDYDNDCDNQ